MGKPESTQEIDLPWSLDFNVILPHETQNRLNISSEKRLNLLTSNVQLLNLQLNTNNKKIFEPCNK
jgi:hypothetical protein